MRAILISLENGFTVSTALTAKEAKSMKADYIILLSNYESINQEDLKIFKQCLASSKLPLKVEDQITTITRVVSDNLISLGVFPETNNFNGPC